MPAKSKKQRLAYLAGIIDGEGSITVSYRKRSGYPKRFPRASLAIYNTNLNLLYWIKSSFGGSVHVYKSRNHNWKPSGCINFGDVASAELLKKLLPFLVIKTEQAKILIAMQETKMPASSGRKLGVPESILKKRESLRVQLQTLNHRGN